MLFPEPPRPRIPGVIEDDVGRQGILYIIGTDEAGRGCLAGPVQAAAVALPVERRIPGVDDSKALSAAARDLLEPRVRAAALAWSRTRAEVEEVDRINVLQASLSAMTRAVAAVWGEIVAAGIPPEAVLVVVDGPRPAVLVSLCPTRSEGRRRALRGRRWRVDPGQGPPGSVHGGPRRGFSRL